MQHGSFNKTLAVLSLLISSTGIATAQTAPDLTGKSGFPPTGSRQAPDLTGKSDNSMFNPNAIRARSGTGPDLTGKVQEERRFASGSQASSANSGGSTTLFLLVLIVGLFLAGGAVMYKQKT